MIFRSLFIVFKIAYQEWFACVIVQHHLIEKKILAFCCVCLMGLFISILLSSNFCYLLFIVAEHRGGHHHGHKHDFTVSSVGIVFEGTFDLDEVRYKFYWFISLFFNKMGVKPDYIFASACIGREKVWMNSIIPRANNIL